MTLIDLFLSWPLWIKFIVGVILLIWSVEAFLLPFKFNLYRDTQKRIETILEQIMGEIKADKKSHIDEQKLLSLLLGTVTNKNE